MAKIAIYNMDGKVQTEKMDSVLLDIAMNETLITQGLRVQAANKRNVIASTKNRGEVRGGGIKPHKQKGTGRARAGSSRSPLWIGGGITFGPNAKRNYKLRLNQKMTQKAIKMLLGQKAKDNKLVVLDKLELTGISTSKAQEFISKLPVEGKILVILDKVNANIELSMANLPYVKVIYANNLNLFDLANRDVIITSTETLKNIDDVLSGKAKQVVEKPAKDKE